MTLLSRLFHTGTTLSLKNVYERSNMLSLETVFRLQTVLRHILDVLVLVLWVGVLVSVLTSLF